MKKYYVYTHSDISGKVFYVGKGTGDRAWRNNRTKEWKDKINLLSNEYYVEIVYDELTEEEALDAEALLIELYGFDNLINKKRESAKSKSTLYYNILQNAKMIKSLYEILDNWEYYKKDKFISKQIKDLIFFQNLQQRIQKKYKLL
jgi:hypothetical protein